MELCIYVYQNEIYPMYEQIQIPLGVMPPVLQRQNTDLSDQVGILSL